VLDHIPEVRSMRSPRITAGQHPAEGAFGERRTNAILGSSPKTCKNTAFE
jgi:hypothetical protein